MASKSSSSKASSGSWSSGYSGSGKSISSSNTGKSISSGMSSTSGASSSSNERIASAPATIGNWGSGYSGTGKSITTNGEVLLPEQPEVDIQARINELKQAQVQSRIAALDKAKNTALTSLDTEKANVSPTYYDKRNQAAANSDVGAMNFAQFMAARGIKGAAGAMPEIYRQAGLQGQIGALDRQEAADLSAIERQKANVETGYASDVAAAESDAEAQAMQLAIQQYNADRAHKLQQQAAALEQQKYTTAQTKSKEDTAKQEWISTIGQYSDDYAAEINELKADGDTSNDWQIPYLMTAANQKKAALAEAQRKAAQQEFENSLAVEKVNKTGGSGGRTSGSSSADIKAANLATRMQEVGSWVYGGKDPKQIEANILSPNLYSQLITEGIDPAKLIDHAYEVKYGMTKNQYDTSVNGSPANQYDVSKYFLGG